MEEQVQKGVNGPTNITNCTFRTIVNWDENASEAVLIVAQALLNLTQLFKNSNVEVTGIRVITGNKEDISKSV